MTTGTIVLALGAIASMVALIWLPAVRRPQPVRIARDEQRRRR